MWDPVGTSACGLEGGSGGGPCEVRWGIGRGCVDHSESFSQTVRLLGFPEGSGKIRFVFCKDGFAAGWRRDGVQGCMWWLAVGYS